MTPLSFEISVETDDATGDVLTVYFQIRKGKSAQTVEYADGAAFADYNRHGELIGVEVLAPCRVSIVDQLAANESAEIRKLTKAFIRRSGPRQMIAA